jgi:hypothetical protein
MRTWPVGLCSTFLTTPLLPDPITRSSCRSASATLLPLLPLALAPAAAPLAAVWPPAPSARVAPLWPAPDLALPGVEALLLLPLLPVVPEASGLTWLLLCGWRVHAVWPALAATAGMAWRGLHSSTPEQAHGARGRMRRSWRAL